MRIALINENSQAAKNEMICSVLKKVVEPMGYEVRNYGMYSAEDECRTTYVQVGILAAVLLNLRAADYVITGRRIRSRGDARLQFLSRRDLRSCRGSAGCLRIRSDQRRKCPFHSIWKRFWMGRRAESSVYF